MKRFLKILGIFAAGAFVGITVFFFAGSAYLVSAWNEAVADVRGAMAGAYRPDESGGLGMSFPDDSDDPGAAPATFDLDDVPPWEHAKVARRILAGWTDTCEFAQKVRVLPNNTFTTIVGERVVVGPNWYAMSKTEKFLAMALLDACPEKGNSYRVYSEAGKRLASFSQLMGFQLY